MSKHLRSLSQMLPSLRHFSAALWILSLLVSPAVLAQQSAADAATNSDPEADTAAVQQARQQAEREAKFKQLDYIQDVLSQKIAERSSLGTSIEAANEQDKDDLRRQADDLTTIYGNCARPWKALQSAAWIPACLCRRKLKKRAIGGRTWR